MQPAINCHVTAKDFQTMMYHCFEKPNSQLKQNVNFKDAIVNLLIIDKNNRNDAIVNNALAIKKIIQELPWIKDSLSFSTSAINEDNELLKTQKIKRCKSFWSMFTTQFDKHPPIKLLVLNRIKALQDDFKKHGINDEVALKTCLKEQSYFDKQPPSYYKDGGNSSAEISYEIDAEKAMCQGTFKDTNMFSERNIESIEKDFPEAANQIRNIRYELVQRAKNGELILDYILVKKNPQTGKADFTMTVYPHLGAHPWYPYRMTMHLLIFDEMVNKRIHTKKDMDQFIKQKFDDSSDPRFYFGSTQTSMVNFSVKLTNCMQGLEVFDDFFASEAKKSTSHQETLGLENLSLQPKYCILNIYSEESMKQLDANQAFQLKTIRDKFVDQAKKGELIKEKIVKARLIDTGPVYFTTENLGPIKDDDVTPYSTTINALVYDEIVNGRIKTTKEMVNFIEKECIDAKSTYFAYIFRHGNEKYKEILKSAHQQFKHFFENNNN